MSDSLRPHESQHTRPPCPSPTPGVHSNSCPSCRWCHPAISSSVVPFSSCPQSLPASESFPMSQLFAWGAKVLAFQLQHQYFQWTPRTDLFRMDRLHLLAVQGTLKSLLQHHSSEESIIRRLAYWPPNYFSIIKFNWGRELLFTLLCILQKLLIIKVHFFSGTERKVWVKK